MSRPGPADRALDDDPAVFDAPRLTAAVPGIGGVIKQRNTDFLVDEQPLYDPCGSGEHLYLLIEKDGLSTLQVVDILARHFDIRRGAIGFAGMKDKHAVTRQVFSVHLPRRDRDERAFEHERARVLWADRHSNKLRLGHLRANRFSVRIRRVRAMDVLHTQRVMRAIAVTGVPNLYGEQRFGPRQRTHILGRLHLLGDDAGLLDELLGPDPAHPDMNPEGRSLYAEGRFEEAIDHFPRSLAAEREALIALAGGATPARAVRAVDRAQRRFWVSAFQSAVFNRVLADRIAAGALAALEPGDLAFLHRNGAVFPVETVDDALADRLAAFEVSPSGPIWGPKMTRAAGAVGDREAAALASAGITPSALDRLGVGQRDVMSGARRAMRIPVIDPEVEGGADEHGEYVRCAFELPPGGYATVVLREIMKLPGPAADRSRFGERAADNAGGRVPDRGAEEHGA